MAFFPKEIIQEVVLTSSDIGTSPVLIIPPMNAGDIYIKDIILTTDGTGLAGGTNFVISTDSSFGKAILMSTAVASLGANATAALDYNVNTTTVITDGGALYAYSTVAPCTGAGKIKITIVAQQASFGADMLGQAFDI